MGEIEEKIEYPWLLFKLNKNNFAISSQRVTGIQILPQSVEKMPDSPECIRGIYSMRGEIVPLLDLRRELGMQPFDEKYGQFVEMLTERQQDHLYWVKELKRTVDAGEEFTLATDPHKCTFGQWLYSFDPEIESIQTLMDKAEGPHRLLHEAAINVQHCTQEHDKCTRAECLKVTLQRVEDEYAPKIIDLMEKMKQEYNDNFREMVLVLDFDGKQVGVIVDEVLAVEKLSMDETNDDSMKKFCDQQFVTGVGKSETVDGVVLLVDERALCGMYCAI